MSAGEVQEAVSELEGERSFPNRKAFGPALAQRVRARAHGLAPGALMRRVSRRTSVASRCGTPPRNY
jgi:hypothetical protein